MTDSVSRMAWRSAILTARCDGDGIAELGEIGDRLDHADDFGGDLLVQLHIALEIRHDRTRQGFRLDGVGIGIGKRDRGRFVIFGAIGVFLDLGALKPLDQHLDGAVGQLEQLQHAGERADLIDRIRGRIIIRRVLLRREHDQRVVLHDFFERADRFLAADEQRHDHVRENNDVAQRQHRIGVAFAVNDSWPGFGAVMAYSFCCAPLHAARHHAQPPQGAEWFRIVWPCSRPHLSGSFAANLTRNFASPIALGGYRPWGCQVSWKRPVNRG